MVKRFQAVIFFIHTTLAKNYENLGADTRPLGALQTLKRSCRFHNGSTPPLVDVKLTQHDRMTIQAVKNEEWKIIMKVNNRSGSAFFFY